MKALVNFLCIFLLSSSVTFQVNELPKSNYVVVGAYSINQEYYAKAYVNSLKEQGFDVQYGLSTSKKLYFVYISESKDFDDAVAKMLATRKNELFSDAWVFVNKIGSDKNVADGSAIEQKEQGEVETNGISQVKDSATPDSSPASSTSSTDQAEQDSPEAPVEELTESADSTNSMVSQNESDEVKVITELSQIGFKVNLYNAQTSTEVNGSVNLVDTERAKRIKQFKAGDIQTISDPGNGTGKLSILVDNFGFRKQQKEINYFNPLTDTNRVDIDFFEGVYEVNFDLIRYGIGDFVVMYNVAFFKDAAVMRPESKFEVNSLLTMMEENPKMKIRIHGHVNGKHPGKIISKGEEQDYFTLSNLNKQGIGSAKELSKKRAELIRDLLFENGVASDRMEIKAWGGKRMIYDKNSTQADENVRVEIEILEN
ncbi:MAG: OmpA family protein [Bacteroidota bacterium]